MYLIFAAIGFVMGLKYAHPFKLGALIIMVIAAGIWSLVTIQTTKSFFLMALITYVFELICFGIGWVAAQLRK